jgi:GNAT superfamily N-acetyltransferase
MSNDPAGLQILGAASQDAEAISGLIHGLARSFTGAPEGSSADGFLQTVSPAAIRGYIEAPNFRYFKAIVEDQLAGVVALRDGAHLYHLFVRPELQGRGLARRLWAHVRGLAEAEGHPGRYTVHSTPSAVPVYKRFGFRAIGPMVEAKGIAYVPMLLEPRITKAR